VFPTKRPPVSRASISSVVRGLRSVSPTPAEPNQVRRPAVCACSLPVRRPAASSVYTLTFARFAVPMTFLKWCSTASATGMPSEKKTMLFRPGTIASPAVIASSASVVEYPCASSSSVAHALCVVIWTAVAAASCEPGCDGGAPAGCAELQAAWRAAASSAFLTLSRSFVYVWMVLSDRSVTKTPTKSPSCSVSSAASAPWYARPRASGDRRLKTIAVKLTEDPSGDAVAPSVPGDEDRLAPATTVKSPISCRTPSSTSSKFSLRRSVTGFPLLSRTTASTTMAAAPETMGCFGCCAAAPAVRRRMRAAIQRSIVLPPAP
jgi:hypothetical protein